MSGRSLGVIILALCCIVFGGTLAIHLSFEALNVILGIGFIVAGILLLIGR